MKNDLILTPEQVSLLSPADLAAQLAEGILESTIDLDPDIADAINRRFWEMYEPINSHSPSPRARAEACLLAAMKEGK